MDVVHSWRRLICFDLTMLLGPEFPRFSGTFVCRELRCKTLVIGQGYTWVIRTLLDIKYVYIYIYNYIYIYMEREGELVINMIYIYIYYIDIEIGMQPGYHDYNGSDIYIYVVYQYTLILEWGYNGDTVGWIYRQPFTRFVMAHANSWLKIWDAMHSSEWCPQRCGVLVYRTVPSGKLT